MWLLIENQGNIGQISEIAVFCFKLIYQQNIHSLKRTFAPV